MKITATHTVSLAAATCLTLYLVAQIFAQPPGLLIFSVNGSGRGQGAILHAGTAVFADEANPAAAGDGLEIYATSSGEGPQAGGSLKECPTPTACAATGMQLSIGGIVTPVLFSGPAPGVRGTHQINAQLPAGLEPSPEVPVQLRIGQRESNEVTIAVR